MDKHERVANVVAAELVGTPVFTHELSAVASILRREYGDERNEGGLARLCAGQAKINERSAALEEAASLAEHHADGSDGLWHAQEVVWGDSIAAAIRALKEAKP